MSTLRQYFVTCMMVVYRYDDDEIPSMIKAALSRKPAAAPVRHQTTQTSRQPLLLFRFDYRHTLLQTERVRDSRVCLAAFIIGRRTVIELFVAFVGGRIDCSPLELVHRHDKAHDQGLEHEL
jgi:hypothetical protein